MICILLFMALSGKSFEIKCQARGDARVLGGKGCDTPPVAIKVGKLENLLGTLMELP